MRMLEYEYEDCSGYHEDDADDDGNDQIIIEELRICDVCKKHEDALFLL